MTADKVGDVFFFVGVGGVDFSGEGGAELEFAFFDAGERAVTVERGHLEIHGAVGSAVGVSFVHEHVDHIYLLFDVRGGGGFDVGAKAVEGVAIGVEFIGPLFGDFGERAVFFAGAADGSGTLNYFHGTAGRLIHDSRC